MSDMQTIARVRRAMPRNADVMAVCDLAEQALTRKPVAPFDRKAYMRDYMRSYRRKVEARSK